MNIYLVRHGRINAGPEVFYGTKDVALSGQGRIQAELTGIRIAKEKIDVFYSSPLKRAMETSRIISCCLDIRPKALRSFREYDFGEWEGKSMARIKKRYPEQFKMWCKSPEEFKSPGGEKFSGFRKRVLSGLDRVAAGGKKGDILIVAHGGVIRAMIADVLGISLKDTWGFALDHCSITLLINSRGCRYIQFLNDTSHLR